MKKFRKAFLLSLALSCTFAVAAAVGCGGGGGEQSSSSASSSTDWFEGEVENTVTLRFGSNSVDMRQYETLALEYTAKGTAQAVEFSSSDEDILTVDQSGVVTTKGVIGKATVTAKVEGLTATCEVNVMQSPYAPVIEMNETEYVVEQGDTLQFSVATVWNKEVLDEEIEYAVSFADGSQDAQAAISVEGNEVKVVANDVEEFGVVVSATVRNIYTSTAFTVKVVEGKLTLKAADELFKPTEGKYEIDIATTDLVASDWVNSAALNFVVAKGTDTVENAQIDWSIEGDAAVLEDNVLIGKKRGTVTLTGTSTVGGETATAQIVCNVLPPEVHLTQFEEIDLQTLSTIKLNDGLLEGDALINAELHGEQVSNRVRNNVVSFNTKLFPKESAKLGAQQLVINTQLVRYVMDVEIYTMVINNAEELDMMREVANLGQTEISNCSTNAGKNIEVNSQYYDGYFVLGNDIAYNKTIMSMTDTGSVWLTQGNASDFSRGFMGVFDGKGYNIDGVTVGANPSGSAKESGGIFGYISKTGVVKNVSFTNATLLANNGFICSMGDGTIENVSISYKKIGGDKETGGMTETEPRRMGSFFSYKCGSNATVRNCLIDASAADITVETDKTSSGNVNYNINLSGRALKTENVIVLCQDDRLLENSGADIRLHNYTELIENVGMFTNFDQSLWTTVENIPMFINQANTLDRDKEVAFLNADDTLVVGFEMLVLANNPYVRIELEEVEGVTLKAGKLTAEQIAYQKTVTLTATSLLNPEKTATHQVYIDSFGKKMNAPETSATPITYNTNPVVTIGDNSWLGEQNYIYLGAEVVGGGTTQLTVDYSKCAWGINTFTFVRETDGVRENFSMDVKLWYTTSKFEQAQIVNDDAFSDWRGTEELYILTEKDADVSAPTGYSKVTRLDCDKEWPTALDRRFFDDTDLSEYKDVWFAFKVVNARYIFQTVTIEETDWVYFHMTQTSAGVWAAEVTIAGKVYTTEFNVLGTNLQQMLYRDGWGNGFLIYNNNSVDINESNLTSIYATEIRGVK